MSEEEKPDDSLMEYLVRVKDNVAKVIPKIADEIPQVMPVSMFCYGRRDTEFAMMRAMQSTLNWRRGYDWLLRRSHLAEINTNPKDTNRLGVTLRGTLQVTINKLTLKMSQMKATHL